MAGTFLRCLPSLHLVFEVKGHQCSVARPYSPCVAEKSYEPTDNSGADLLARHSLANADEQAPHTTWKQKDG